MKEFFNPRTPQRTGFQDCWKKQSSNGHCSGAEVLAPPALPQAPGQGGVSSQNKIQRTPRSTAKIFKIVQRLGARQTPNMFVSAALPEAKGVRGAPTTTSHWKAAPRTSRTAATQVLLFLSPLCQKIIAEGSTSLLFSYDIDKKFYFLKLMDHPRWLNLLKSLLILIKPLSSDLMPNDPSVPISRFYNYDMINP